MDLQDLSIGVLGNIPEQRSSRDQEMQSIFGQGMMELYQRLDYESRLSNTSNGLKPTIKNNDCRNVENYNCNKFN
jgi:hypothetical protein